MDAPLWDALATKLELDVLGNTKARLKKAWKAYLINITEPKAPSAGEALPPSTPKRQYLMSVDLQALQLLQVVIRLSPCSSGIAGARRGRITLDSSSSSEEDNEVAPTTCFGLAAMLM